MVFFDFSLNFFQTTELKLKVHFQYRLCSRRLLWFTGVARAASLSRTTNSNGLILFIIKKNVLRNLQELSYSSSSSNRDENENTIMVVFTHMKLINR